MLSLMRSGRECAGTGTLPRLLSSGGHGLRIASTRPLCRQQTSSEQIQIGEREGGEQSGSILRQAPITHLSKAPQALHYVKGVLPTRTGGRAQTVQVPLVAAEPVAVVATTVDA